MMTLRPEKGTYLLILKAIHQFECEVGKLGWMAGVPGFYCYVGSAQGPGGVLARVKHHLTVATRPHWHLDYLRPYVQPLEVWCCYSPVFLEHRWANTLIELAHDPLPMPGFGASDCACDGHLTYFKHPPSIGRFKNQLLTLDAYERVQGERQFTRHMHNIAASLSRIKIE